MADIYDSILDRAPSQNPAPEGASIYDTLLDQRIANQNDRLMQNLASAAKVNPDLAGEAQRLATQTNIPPEIAQRNMDEARQRARVMQVERMRLMKQSPILAMQLQDESFAQIAQDQIEPLSRTEKVFKWFSDIPSDISKGWEAGRLQVEQGYIGQRAQSGTATEEDMKRVGAIDTRLKQLKGTGGFSEATSKILGQMSETMPEAIKYGEMAALTTGGAALIAGQLGPQVALPEEIVTVPTAAIGGFFAGMTAKMAEQSYRIEAGSAYLDMIKEGIDRNTAVNVSAGVGLVNAALEVTGIGMVAAPIKSALIKEVTKEVTTAFTKPTVKMAVTEFAKNYGKAWGGEVTTEILQEFSNIAGEEIARSISKPEMESKLATPEGRAELAKRIGEVFEEVGKGMAVLALPGASFNFRADVKRAAEAKRQSEFLEDLTKESVDSVVRQRNPDAFEKFIAAQAEGGPAENIYIEAQQLDGVLRQQGITREQLQQAMPEVVEQLDQAMAAGGGGDVVIPTASYAARVAGTEIGNALKVHMRLSEDAMSVAEMQKFDQNRTELMNMAKFYMEQKQEADEAFVKSAKEVEAILFSQIKETGTYTDRASRNYAEFVRDFVVTQSADLGVMPVDFYNQYMYKIQGQQQAAQMPSELFDQAGNVLTSSEAFQRFYGQSVFKDQEGNPLVLYHGTTADVSEFDLDHPGRKDSGWLGTGVYLTDNATLAEIYADQKARKVSPAGQNVMPLYARLENPYYATAEDKARIKAGGREAADAFTQQLKEQGYDGVILPLSEEANEIVVFDPAGVKSQFNSGAWSRETADILAQRGKPQAEGRVVPSTVEDASNVDGAFKFAASQAFKTNRDFKMAIQGRVLAAAKAAKIDLSDFTANVERYLVRVAMLDAVMALETNPNAVGWYNEKVTKALRIISLIHPEVATSREAKFAFTWALAVTSNGLKVDKNFELAERAYKAFKETGRMPTDMQAGQAQIAINESLGLYNELVDKYGLDTVIDFMTTKQTVKEVEAFTGKNVSGENLTTEVYGAAALGPKIGNGFFANLYGHFEQLTMDRWLMRTWGRWTGTLVEDNKAQAKIKRDQLKALIKLLTPEQKKAFEAVIKTKLAVGKLDEVAVAINKASVKPANRVAMAAIADAMNDSAQAELQSILGPLKKGQKRVSYGDELRKVGNSLTGYLDGQKEAPSGPPERGRIRKVMGQVLTSLQQSYPELTMSDLQALLWYPEKRLYDSAKTSDEGQTGYEDDEAPDYANAAAALAKELGVPSDVIDRTIKEVDDELAVRAAERATATQRDAGDGLFRQGARAESTGTIIFEVAPDPNNAELSDRWNQLSAEQRIRISEQVAKQVVPGVLDVSGASGQVTGQIGSYLNDTNPSFAIRLDGGNPMEVAKALGFVLSQDSMMAISTAPFDGSFGAVAVRISVGQKTEAEIDAIYQALRGIEGQPQIQGQTTSDGVMTVLLGEGVDAKAMASAMDEKLGGQYEIVTHTINAAFPEKQEYDYASERSDPAGNEGVARQRYRDARAEAGQFLDGAIRRAGILDQLARDGGGRAEGGSLAPLEGAPSVRGFSGPDPRLVAVAEQYAREIGITLRRQAEYVQIDPDRSARLAEAYEAMQHAPQDPAVREAYENLIKQTRAQYDALAKAGYKFWFTDETSSDYLSTPWNAMRDIRANQSMGVYPTDDGFGTSDFNPEANPLLADTGLMWPVGGPDGTTMKPVLANDLFRAVHDAFGHGLEGAGFRAQGEENAWQAHARLFTGSALAALTSETRGQNSWLNFGPHGQANQTAKVEDTVFADQKAGLMPEWTWTEGVAGDMPAEADMLRQESEAASRRLAQGGEARGGFDPRKLTTILNEKADYSTFLHETAHFFLTVYADMAARPEATQRMKDDMQTLLDWFGIKDLATWNAMSLEEQRKYHEQFAYNYEIYLFEGKAPDVKMQGLFDRFSAFLKRVYVSIRDDLNKLYREENGEDLPILTGEVRQVMDRMLASEQQINQAEQVRGMAAMFQTQEQSGMDDATWAAYQEMLKEAHDASVTELTNASVRQLKWLSNARGRLLKEMQKTADAQRSEVRGQVAEEVKNLPVYRAMEFLKRGKIEGVDVDYPVKLSIPEIEAMYGDNPIVGTIKKSLGFGKYGMLGTENAIHPDQVAEMFQFESGDALIRALLEAKPMKDEINERTDQRMLEEYSELSDPKAMEDAVEAALHNEARARFVAVELRFMSKATAPVRVMMNAAKQVASQIMSGKKLSEIKPRQYSMAEARAAKQAESLMKKGESLEAQKAKQNQLIQNQLAAQATEAKAEVLKAMESFKKLFKSDDRLSKTRNMDLVDAARSILAFYGIGGKKGKSPIEFIEKLRAYNPEMYAEIEPLIIDAASGSKQFTDLTLEEFRSLRDTIEALWFQSKRENEIMIEGKLVAKQEAVDALVARLEAIGVPTEVPGERAAPSKKDRAVRMFNNTKAITRRIEHWADATDGASGVGPFTTYIWRPIRQALDAYRTERNKYVKRYVDLLKKLELPVAKIEATELNYTFGNENGGIGKAELLGALLHTGNESNLKKLLLGRGWGRLNEDGSLDASAWRAFEKRMIDEGKLTKADYDWAQSVWDLNEEMKPMAQQAHHDIFGYYFKEVAASPVVTPFGTYRGGYVPAKTDQFLVRDAQKNAKMEELESDFRNSMPSTGMGFTKGRVEYNKPLSLDVRLLAKHIDDVIRFAFVQPAIKDVLGLIRNKEFADTLTRIDPSAIEDMLLPWLNRAARQITSESGMHKGVDQFWRTVRARTGISIMFANLTNAVQQLTGYFLAAVKVKPTYLKEALVSYISNTQKVSEQVAELSPFMADRMQNQMFDLQDNMNELLLNPSRYEKVQKWAQHHGYFLQSAFQNQVDIVTWTATYNQTLAELGADVSDERASREAVQRADAAVRLTQGSLASEDIAAFEVGSPFYKTLIQFSGYFNMMANLNANEYIKIFRDLGWRGNKGKIFVQYLLGFALPMIMADAIVRTLGGQWDDEDDDGYLDEIMEWFFGSQIKGAVAMVPFGTAAMVPFNAFNNKPYDDRMTTSPSVSILEAATVGTVKAGINIADPDKQVTGKNVRDVLTLLSLVTGIPLTVLGRPIGYAVDVERGKIHPEGPLDTARGLITGKASEESTK